MTAPVESGASAERKQRMVWAAVRIDGANAAVALVVTDQNLERVASSPELMLDDAAAEPALLGFLKEHCEPTSSPLCGHAVWRHKQHLIAKTPAIVDFLHYRIVDVATIRELVRRWHEGKLYASGTGASVVDEIEGAIAELAHYRREVFTPL